MAVLNIITFVSVFVVTVQVFSVPIENEWLVNAQKSINDSYIKIKSYGGENEQIKMFSDEAFESFTEFVKNRLSNIIDQIEEIKSDEIIVLKAQLLKWSEALVRLNKGNDQSKNIANVALGKFLLTVDYMSKEIIGFDKKYNYESSESKHIVEELQSLLQVSVTKLVEYAKAVEDQVSGVYETA